MGLAAPASQPRSAAPANPMPLRFASYLGDNALDFYGRVVAYLGAVTGLGTTLVVPAPEQETAFDHAQVEAAFTCGLPYILQSDRPAPAAHLLAAPVMPGERYEDRPVYFADLIVRRDAPYERLADLRGATFAYNQATSFSGYVLPRYHLLTQGLDLDFFGESCASGSHAASMDWVESGRAAAAAIDSVVLDMELLQRPERAARLRVIASIGPAGMPPVVASAQLDPAVQAALRDALTTMHTDPAGLAILRQGGMRRFAPVTSADYNDVRRMWHTVEAQT